MNGLNKEATTEPTDKRVHKRVPVALRIKLRYRQVDTFVSKFATNISATGIFISSRKPKPKNTQLRFELRLADDSVVISGRGRVAWTLPYDSKTPKAPHGMGVEFTSLNKGSRELIQRIVEERIEQGLGEGDGGIPYAVKEEDLAQAVVKQLEEPAGEPMGKVPNAPESSSVVELSLDDLDSASINLIAVLERARALVGDSSADEELASLFRVSAAPVAETVDDASHKLAQLLGGTAVETRARHAALTTDEESRDASERKDTSLAEFDVIEDPATPVPAQHPTDALALSDALEGLSEEESGIQAQVPELTDESTDLVDLEDALAELEDDKDSEEVTEGSVDFILDDEALSELEVHEDDTDDAELDLPDIPQ